MDETKIPACPNCGRRDRWRCEEDVSDPTLTYVLRDGRWHFDGLLPDSDLIETRHVCECGAEIAHDEDEWDALTDLETA
jgi:hypothetical protein